MKTIGIISPQDWGLPVFSGRGDVLIPSLGIRAGEIEERIRNNVYLWLPRHIETGSGAFYGFFRPPDGYREPPQTANLIASWELAAAYDRFSDETLLEQASQALEFFYRQYVVSHPMSVVAGGARDGVAKDEVWTKFSAEFVIGALALHQRTGRQAWLERAQQSGRYLLQAARHGFAPKYFLQAGQWSGLEFGWNSWGRVIEALLCLVKVDPAWKEPALRWGEHALSIQAGDGCYYLIDGEYYNSDLAADELRGLIFLYEITGDRRYLTSARRFADWHLERQRTDGAWAMTWDRDGNLIVPTVGPGDVPNIAVSLLRMHAITGESAYLESALQAFHYSLSKQILPGSSQPYSEDPDVQWGFWSWDPYYDYTLSADQATHHVRGMMFLLDYLSDVGNI